MVCSTGANDIWFGSSGSLLPMTEAKIVSPEGKEITGYDQPGELIVKSPSVVLGYLNNDKANEDTFKNGWLYTGDEAVVRIGPKGHEHIFIVDRIKELIKVKVSRLLCAYSHEDGFLTISRGCKLRRQSSRLTFYHTRLWLIAR